MSEVLFASAGDVLNVRPPGVSWTARSNRMPTICPLLGRPTQVGPTPYSQGAFRLVQCLETGFVFLENPPDYDEVRNDFPWEITTQREVARRREAEPAFSRLSAVAKRVKQRLFPKRNHMHALAERVARRWPVDRSLTLLDVGCGAGCLAIDCCRRFRDAGRNVRPIGIELSPLLAQAADRALENWSGRAIEAPALSAMAQFDEASIDIAIMSSFLEHDPQPLDLLVALRPKLRSDGAVLIKVPNFASLNRRLRGSRWCGFRYPDHVNYFTPTTLRRLTAEAGYRFDRPGSGDRMPLSDNMYATLRPS